MTKEEIDILWHKAMRLSIEDGDQFTRYRFAELVVAAERNRTWTQDHWTEYERSIAAAAKAEEREACAKACDSISEDQWALYKGRPPYTGKEIERASDYTQGKSDGAEVCAAAIRARGQA